jgi:hypothetical protein
LKLSSLTVQPGKNATLSFSGVISLQPENDMMEHPAIVVTPIAGDNYTGRLTGEGFFTFNVIAKS